ncbi:hypothetical protein GCM10023215_39320 [Pseudonocardia yuanmonensis]|uniref:Uncharacterized protein n=1 Tax=Pseudonocardia yuanmonensis TaxID=1095914 RepID=A0ABP8WZR0_9PSEU
MARLVGVPRWIRVLVLVAAVLVLLAVLAMVTGVGGEHGPGRHVGQPIGASAIGTVFLADLAVSSAASRSEVLTAPGWGVR